MTVLYLLTTTKSIQQSVIWIWQFVKRFQRKRTSYWSQDSKTIIQYEWQSPKLITDMDIHCILNVYLFQNIDKMDIPLKKSQWIYLNVTSIYCIRLRKRKKDINEKRRTSNVLLCHALHHCLSREPSTIKALHTQWFVEGMPCKQPANLPSFWTTYGNTLGRNNPGVYTKPLLWTTPSGGCRAVVHWAPRDGATSKISCPEL